LVRDEEIGRLIKYAQGLGVRVSFIASGDDAAGWTVDGSEIYISRKHNRSKIDIVLSLIHEIAHQLYFIHEKNRQPDLKFEEALDRQNLFDYDLAETPAPKTHRKRILDVEVTSAEWWETIYKETNCSFPIWRLHAQKQFDLYQYQHYYKTGHFPNKKQKNLKFKEIRLHYKQK